MKFLDPRVNRLNLPSEYNEGFELAQELDQWETYEVFHQKNRGEQHVHVGCVHAPSAELALLFAKEQYARRAKCSNLWVVKTADITPSSYEDEDIFVPAVDKTYREAYGYKVRPLINTLQKNQPSSSSYKVSIQEVTNSKGKKSYIIQKI
jgi:ring-1,2-phenylacetyl-CoA epoxidase subunit PaaB